MEQKLGKAKRLYFEKSLVSSNFEGFNTDASYFGLMANVIPFLKPPADAIPGVVILQIENKSVLQVIGQTILKSKTICCIYIKLFKFLLTCIVIHVH